jgi:hypothetical protein
MRALGCPEDRRGYRNTDSCWINPHRSLLSERGYCSTVDMQYLRTEKHIADELTKALYKDKFIEFRMALGVKWFYLTTCYGSRFWGITKQHDRDVLKILVLRGRPRSYKRARAAALVGRQSINPFHPHSTPCNLTWSCIFQGKWKWFGSVGSLKQTNDKYAAASN